MEHCNCNASRHRMRMSRVAFITREHAPFDELCYYKYVLMNGPNIRTIVHMLCMHVYVRAINIARTMRLNIRIV